MGTKLSKRLRFIRDQRGLSQKFVAEKIGVRNNTLSGYESGRREPDAATLEKLADLYQVSVDYLLGRTDKQKYDESNEYDPVAELKQYLIDNNMTEYGFGFYDVEQWKKLGPEEIEEVKRHFDWVVAKAEQMKKEEEEQKKKD